MVALYTVLVGTEKCIRHLNPVRSVRSTFNLFHITHAGFVRTDVIFFLRTGLYYHVDREKAYDPRAENEEFGKALYKRAVEVINKAYGENILTNHAPVLSELTK